jgi:aspartate/tyrosine/aromatic aminotransferase
MQLEVERNHKIEAVRQVEEELRCQFSKELESMKQKIELLERELKRCNAANSTNVKSNFEHIQLSGRQV